MTDLHIRPKGEKLASLDPDQRLQQSINSINAKHSDADLCVITGDLVDQGEIAAYRLLRRRLLQLQVPWQLLIGNHDNRDNFCSVFPETRIDSSGFIQSFKDIGDLRLIFLDTLDNEYSGGGGILCEQRMRWLTQLLEKAKNRRIFIFMHHPPKSVRVKWFDDMLLKKSDAFMSLIAAYPSIIHLAFGHLHLTLTGRWGATSFSCNRGTCHKIADFNLVGHGVDYVRIGPAYDILLSDGDELIVHHMDPAGTMELLASETRDPTGIYQLHYPEDGSGETVEC